MRVHVDEAWQAGVAGEVEHRHMRACGVIAAGAGLQLGDSAVTNDDQHIVLCGVGVAVEQLSAADGHCAAVGRVRYLADVEAIGQRGRCIRAAGKCCAREQRAAEAGHHASGMNSWLSKSGSFMRPARQSDLACSMRSLEDETKFHSMKRSPTGSPPSAMSVERAVAVTVESSPWSKTSILPAP